MSASIYNTEEFTKEDFKLARDSWRRDLCGDEITNDKSIPGVENILFMYDLDSEKFREDMNRGADAKLLFGSHAPELSGELKIQYDAIYRMALPYGTVGCRGYRSPELLSDVLYALEWMYENMYGENVLTDTSFRSWKLYDWWDWYVGAACPMMNTLMIIEDGLCEEQIKKYTTPISFLRYKMKTLPENYMSRMMSMTPLALLTCDRPLLKQLYEECNIALEELDCGNEMRRDMCCMTHGLVYNIGYGFINLDRTARIVKILSTTPLAYPLSDEKKYFIMKMIRYTFAPSMYKGRPFVPMNGRNLQVVRSVLNPLKYFYYAYGVFGEDEDREIKEIIRRNATEYNKNLLISHFDRGITLEEYRSINGGNGRSLYEPVTKIVTYSMLYDALNNEKYDTPPYTLGYMWYSGDTGVQFRNGYMVGVRMFSERAPSYECINGMNADGWYTGEGAVYLYTEDASKEYTPEWWKSADKHLIPGTTVEDRVREPMNFEFGYKNSQSFVGGVTLDGQFLTMTMDYEAFHNEVAGTEVDNGHGRGWPVYLCTLTAKKSYFMLDRAIVCIGCDVHAEDGYSVRTVVDNRIMTSDFITVNGEKIAFTPSDVSRSDVKYIYFGDGAAYLFPRSQDLVIRFYEKGGVRRVAVWLDHGMDPVSESYEYVILPGATLAEAEDYDISDIEILRNDSGIQAVLERHSGLMGVVFRKKGTFNKITAKQPMIAIAKRDTGGRIIDISLADPTTYLESYECLICDSELSSDDECIQCESKNGSTTITVKCDSARGRSYTLNTKFK